eukprot:jgi/Mesvir1/9166/Mv13710-RA.1
MAARLVFLLLLAIWAVGRAALAAAAPLPARPKQQSLLDRMRLAASQFDFAGAASARDELILSLGCDPAAFTSFIGALPSTSGEGATSQPDANLMQPGASPNGPFAATHPWPTDPVSMLLEAQRQAQVQQLLSAWLPQQALQPHLAQQQSQQRQHLPQQMAQHMQPLVIQYLPVVAGAGGQAILQPLPYEAQDVVQVAWSGDEAGGEPAVVPRKRPKARPGVPAHEVGGGGDGDGDRSGRGAEAGDGEDRFKGGGGGKKKKERPMTLTDQMQVLEEEQRRLADEATDKMVAAQQAALAAMTPPPSPPPSPPPQEPQVGGPVKEAGKGMGLEEWQGQGVGVGVGVGVGQGQEDVGFPSFEASASTEVPAQGDPLWRQRQLERQVAQLQEELERQRQQQRDAQDPLPPQGKGQPPLLPPAVSPIGEGSPPSGWAGSPPSQPRQWDECPAILKAHTSCTHTALVPGCLTGSLSTLVGTLGVPWSLNQADLGSPEADTIPTSQGATGVPEAVRLLLPPRDVFAAARDPGGPLAFVGQGVEGAASSVPARLWPSCAVVGDAATLKGSGQGAAIDAHRVILRLNGAPTKGYEGDVGSRTTMRLQQAGYYGWREGEAEICVGLWSPSSSPSTEALQQLGHMVDAKVYPLSPPLLEWMEKQTMPDASSQIPSGRIRSAEWPALLLALLSCRQVDVYGHRGGKGGVYYSRHNHLQRPHGAIQGPWTAAGADGVVVPAGELLAAPLVRMPADSGGPASLRRRRLLEGGHVAGQGVPGASIMDGNGNGGGAAAATASLGRVGGRRLLQRLEAEQTARGAGGEEYTGGIGLPLVPGGSGGGAGPQDEAACMEAFVRIGILGGFVVPGDGHGDSDNAGDVQPLTVQYGRHQGDAGYEEEDGVHTLGARVDEEDEEHKEPTTSRFSIVAAGRADLDER